MTEPKTDATLEELEDELKSLEEDYMALLAAHRESLPDPLKNMCPQCHVDAGAKCVTPRGKFRYIHKLRENLIGEETQKLNDEFGAARCSGDERQRWIRSQIDTNKALACDAEMANEFMSKLELCGDSQAVTAEHDGSDNYEVVSVTNINGLYPFDKIHGKITITLMFRAGVNVTLNKKKESPQSHKFGAPGGYWAW